MSLVNNNYWGILTKITFTSEARAREEVVVVCNEDIALPTKKISLLGKLVTLSFRSSTNNQIKAVLSHFFSNTFATSDPRVAKDIITGPGFPANARPETAEVRPHLVPHFYKASPLPAGCKLPLDQLWKPPASSKTIDSNWTGSLPKKKRFIFFQRKTSFQKHQRISPFCVLPPVVLASRPAGPKRFPNDFLWHRCWTRCCRWPRLGAPPKTVTTGGLMVRDHT